MDYPKIVFKNILLHLQDKTFLKALAAVWFFFGGIHLYIYSVFALTVADVVTGIIKSLKRGEGFSSRKLRKGLLEKLAIYLVLLLTVFVLDMVTKSIFHHTGHYFVFVITFLIATYETTSIIENIAAIHPNLPFLNGLVKIFGKLSQGTMDSLEKKVDDITDGVTDFKDIINNQKES